MILRINPEIQFLACVLIAFQFAFLSEKAHAQCTAKAAVGDTICFHVDGGIRLGGFPSATGGTPPYSYLWTVLHSSTPHDSIINNPKSPNPGIRTNGYAFIELLVTDNLGATCRDSVFVRASEGFNRHNMTQRDIVWYGDSIRLSMSYGFWSYHYPLKYCWTPSTWLSDSTQLRTFAKPQDSIIYTLQVHTSTGCIFYDTYTLDVIRRPESTAVIPNNNLGLKVDDHSIVVESNVEIFQDYSVEILGISGEVLVRQKITDNKMRISTSGISAGPYLATVLDQYDEIVFRKWIYLNN